MRAFIIFLKCVTFAGVVATASILIVSYFMSQR